MSCNHCSTKFNFFHKEMGCANCGLSFCNKCVKQKSKIPTKEGEYNVCRLCFSKLASGSSSDKTNVVQPPDMFIKRLENLENPSAPPITVYRRDPKMQCLRSGLSPLDQKLVDRLEKLKDDNKAPPPSESEIRMRLANLKGENNYVETSNKPVYSPPENKTEQQMVDSLLEQFSKERDIELQHNPTGEIEVRLANLREKGIRPNEGPYISNLHDSSGSEEEVDKITKKIMDEVALDEKCSALLVKPTNSSCDNDEEEEDEMTGRSSPELPWCVLCNKDATYRCLDCGGDLYCSQCNVEVHKTWGDTDHKVIPYKSKQ